MEYDYAPFGAVYRASRLRLGEVFEVGCPLELLCEFSAVPVWTVIVREATPYTVQCTETGSIAYT